MSRGRRPSRVPTVSTTNRPRSRSTVPARTSTAKPARAAAPSVLTGRQRVQIQTGSVREYLDRLPAVDYEQPHGAALHPAVPAGPAPSPVSWRTAVPARTLTQFPDRDVEWAIGFITRSELAAFFTDATLHRKQKPGRPARTSPLAVLVAMWLAATDGRGMLITNFRDILFRRLSPTMQTRLGLRDTTVPSDPQAQHRFDDAAEASVRRTLHRMLVHIDPSIYPKNRIRPWAELTDLARDLTAEQQTDLLARLNWTVNQLLDNAFRTLPREIRRRYNGSGCIDATPLPLASRGHGVDSPIADADPDGGWYIRTGDHADPGNRTPNIKKAMWALDISLFVAVDDSPGTRQHLPALPLSMTTDRPGVDPTGAARRLFASLKHRGYSPGYLAGDRLYTNAEQSTFQVPARDLGYQLVLGYPKALLGVQETTGPA